MICYLCCNAIRRAAIVSRARWLAVKMIDVVVALCWKTELLAIIASKKQVSLKQRE